TPTQAIRKVRTHFRSKNSLDKPSRLRAYSTQRDERPSRHPYDEERRATHAFRSCSKCSKQQASSCCGSAIPPWTKRQSWWPSQVKTHPSSLTKTIARRW